MIHIPDEFRDLPEAERLRRAGAEFSAAAQRARKAIGGGHEAMRLCFEETRRAQFELQEAQRAFDAATGEPKPVGLTLAVIAKVERQFSAEQRDAVKELLDRSCGRTLPLMRDATPEALERIRLCALKIAKGDVAKLRQAVDLANIDWRDLICAAEAQ